MPNKENNPGLLSKVAKFVRNPTTNWTDLDKQDPEPDTGYSKQALKEMIERKRQNDFVRKREFDQLRKLRSRDPSGGNPDLAGRPSYFQSSLPSNSDERAMTIKKIDEIEAQMSNQWWQGKNAPAKAAGAAAVAKAQDHAATDKDAPAAADQAYAATRLSPMVPERVLSGSETSDFPPTQDNSGFGPQSTPPAPVAAAAGAKPAAADKRTTDPVGASRGGQNFAVEIVDDATDPELEEAAIRFANGDNDGAEAGLQAALKDTDAPLDHCHAWAAALFDLYRATGQQTRFDVAAIELARRFGRSAPAWFSMPEMLGLTGSDAVVRTLPSRLMEEPIWRSPAEFVQASVDDLQLAIANATAPWFLDWSDLKAMLPDGARALSRLFDEWCSTAVGLRFAGARNLDKVLRAAAPSGDRSVDQANWNLRMDALRIMRLQDEFELVALDYCVTYEVSPPSWQDARCDYQATATSELAGAPDSRLAPAGPNGFAAATDDHQDFRPAATVPMGLEAVPAAVVELSGEIIGEATDAIAQLELARQDASQLVVSCAHLIRVDFSAAGSLLNWVAQRQAEGCHLQFRDVHRLVGAFFSIVGINEHARVVLRSN